MGILSGFDFDSIPEVGAAPQGEYEVTIVDAGDYVGKESGKQSIRVVLDIPSEVAADSIYHYLSLPMEGDEEKTKFRKLKRIKDFLQAFGLSQEQDYEDWKGATAWALVDVEEDNHGEPRNVVKRFIAR